MPSAAPPHTALTISPTKLYDTYRVKSDGGGSRGVASTTAGVSDAIGVNERASCETLYNPAVDSGRNSRRQASKAQK
jgi:hypothetical protein